MHVQADLTQSQNGDLEMKRQKEDSPGAMQVQAITSPAFNHTNPPPIELVDTRAVMHSSF